MLLIISDGFFNGKGLDCKLIDHNYHFFCYDPIPNNIFANVRAVIFNYNESLFTYRLNWNPNLRKHYASETCFKLALRSLSDKIRDKYNHITIYNDPSLCLDQSSKFITNKKMNGLCNIKLPSIVQITQSKDLYLIQQFPVIVKLDGESHNSGGVNDMLCRNHNQLKEVYEKSFFNYKNTIVVEYMDSFDSVTNGMISVRIMIYKDRIHDIYIRPSKHWNGHNQCQNVDAIEICYNAYGHILMQYDYDSLLKKIYETYGYGFFAVDCTYDAKNNQLGLCEIGLKFIDYTYHAFMTKHDITVQKSLQVCYDDLSHILSSHTKPQ